MLDQQVNPVTPRYPVDRYLVDRSNKFEMVNIIEDDIWNAEPALRPEDEIILKKLHEMLQSTADDLKLLSGELSKYHEPGVQVKSLPTPLDEDFNLKVHIEEIVNAKFHGYKVIEKSAKTTSADAHKHTVKGLIKSITSDLQKTKKVVSTGIQVDQLPISKNPIRKNNFALSKTNILQIDENTPKASNDSTEHGNKHKEKVKRPTVAYNEFTFKHVETKIKQPFQKSLQVQNMPSINIRSELKEQKVLQLNIEPEIVVSDGNVSNNIAVISVHHEPVTVQKTVSTFNHNQVQCSMASKETWTQETSRKISKMSSCESSESINNRNTEIHSVGKPHRETKVIRPQTKARSENIKYKMNRSNKRDSAKHSNLDEWKKKLNAIYVGPTSSKKAKSVTSQGKTRKIESKPRNPNSSQRTRNAETLNNIEYIPYSKLTLGGVRVSDIEKELSEIPHKSDVVLSPILDKILSRENSFSNEFPQVHTHDGNPEILTTSDENLLQEVLDLERSVNKTLTKNVKEIKELHKDDQLLNDVDDQESYIDDFEDEKSDYSGRTENLNQSSKSKSSDDDANNVPPKSKKENVQNRDINIMTKRINLSLKNEVDIFEFIHSINTQETGTQSSNTQKRSLKETQTSPRNDKCNVQPIHNDLWPSIDPKGEVEKLFKLEKDFIKKLIVEEYGDLLEKNLNKPSTSNENFINDEKNAVCSQKNTQTSPAHVKSVMTSPTRTKTRTTSPFAVSMTFDRQTSPANLEELKISVEDGDDLGISVNLSSPRFSLRLPQTCHEVLSNIESHVKSKHNQTELSTRESRGRIKNAVSSSSSADGDYSSSDISSLGEVRFKLKRRLRKLKVPSISELSSSMSPSKCSSDISETVVPLRSEGEVSLGQINRKKSNNNRSEGETSLRRFR